MRAPRDGFLLGNGPRRKRGREAIVGIWREVETIYPICDLSVMYRQASSAFFAVQRPAMCIYQLQYLHFGYSSGKADALEIANAATI
ncbi:hypothetical protein RLEG12_16095 [Rhizobium leguminosarum bv. trifolii CB782]|nr:hypothetical protein RLEG12_16095 [Rhizobium leguminosarum bv. trifolii CB782]